MTVQLRDGTLLVRVGDDGKGLGVLVLSTYVEPVYAIRLLQSGGRGVGYLLKDRVDDVDTLVEGLQRVARGGSVVDPEAMEQLVLFPAPHRVASLSRREHDVLALVAQGRSNPSIAPALRLAQKTGRGSRRRHLHQARAAAAGGDQPARPRRAGVPQRLRAVLAPSRTGEAATQRCRNLNT